NNESLKEKGFETFRKNFNVSEKMLNNMIALGEKNKLEFNEKQFSHSKELIKTHVKAQIARGIWRSGGFYPIYNETNEIFQQALQLFDEAEQLAAK
ncbi:MAG: carboxyl-terminal processing protease, partial [Bacteroidia bacterium]